MITIVGYGICDIPYSVQYTVCSKCEGERDKQTDMFLVTHSGTRHNRVDRERTGQVTVLLDMSANDTVQHSTVQDTSVQYSTI